MTRLPLSASLNILHSSLLCCKPGSSASCDHTTAPMGSLACWLPVCGASQRPQEEVKMWEEREARLFPGHCSCIPRLGAACLVGPTPHHSSEVQCCSATAPLRPLLSWYIGYALPRSSLRLRTSNSFPLLQDSWYLNLPYLFPYPTHTSVGSLSPASSLLIQEKCPKNASNLAKAKSREG